MKIYHLIPLLLSQCLFAVLAQLSSPSAEESSQALMDSIVADFRSEAYDSALAKLIEIEKEKPYDPEILNLLGSVYMKKKDFVSATKYFDLSLNKKPGFFPAAFNYGELLFIQKNTRKLADTIRCCQRRIPEMSFCNSNSLFVTLSSATNPRPNFP